MNHRTLLEIMKYKIPLTTILSHSRVYISHFDDDFNFDAKFLANLRIIEKIIVQNSSTKNLLSKLDIPDEKISVAIGAIDRSVFFPSINYVSTQSYVAISGDCKPRKNPQKILELISSCPHFEFKIHGKGWDLFFAQEKFAPANLQLIDFNYSKQGAFLRNAGVSVSLATIEGGPLTILESLACGTPVVATNIGFWPDIHNSELGSIIELDANLNSIIGEVSKQ